MMWVLIGLYLVISVVGFGIVYRYRGRDNNTTTQINRAVFATAWACGLIAILGPSVPTFIHSFIAGMVALMMVPHAAGMDLGEHGYRDTVYTRWMRKSFTQFIYSLPFDKSNWLSERKYNWNLLADYEFTSYNFKVRYDVRQLQILGAVRGGMLVTPLLSNGHYAAALAITLLSAFGHSAAYLSAYRSKRHLTYIHSIFPDWVAYGEFRYGVILGLALTVGVIVTYADVLF